jgi:sugar O-acyltransferase (sialic acid O-acetyltransferase NeuD family)
MSQSFIVLIGAGGHARSCIDVIEQQRLYKIAGLVGTAEQLNETVLGYRVIAIDEDLDLLVARCPNVLIAVGQIKNPSLRMRLFNRAIKAGFNLPTIISPHAYVSKHATLGRGSIVMSGAVINAGVRIGDNCIINTRATLEHDSVIADHCHISTGVLINGGVTVGQGTFIGSGSIIRDNTIVRDNQVLTMGSIYHGTKV